MSRRLITLTAVAALALVGCTADDPEPTDQMIPDAGADAPETPQDGESGPGAAIDAGQSPEPGQCISLPESPDGLYSVADAGTVVVRLEDGRLVLGDVTPAEGWEYEVTDQDDDDVEVEFRRNGEELDLEVELDDGRVVAEVCSDDD